MYKKTLEGIGLTPGEVKVYSALIELGESTTGKIISHSKLSSGKIYEILDKLIHKGLATFILKEKTKYFSATDPNKILEYVDDKKKAIEEKREEIKNILPDLIRLNDSKKQDYRAVIYKGLEGVKTATFESLNELEPGEFFLNIGASEKRSPAIALMWHQFEALRNKKRVKIKFLVSPDANFKDYKTIKKKDIRTALIAGKVPISVAKRSVLIYNFTELSVIKITNQDVADSFKDFFNVLWGSSGYID